MIQLGGGNDGLNSVVPYGDKRYYRARPTLAIKQGVVPHRAALIVRPYKSGAR